ncbi:unnamed protein product [Orchesella dallaii]|uniref:C2H2-type domain-containing protein n=1 Tax=Orchesella dallaii TaxID=48710 RepID=A0ABP1QRT0_9HEXA
MGTLEQQVKELQVGLVAVIQALDYIQTFMESDYGLKFQFHAYRSSSPYSEHCELLKTLKTKLGHKNETFPNEKVFRQEDDQDQDRPNSTSTTFTRNEPIQYYTQETRLESNATATIVTATPSSNPAMLQSFVPICDSQENHSNEAQVHPLSGPAITGNFEVLETKTGSDDKSALIGHHEGIPVFTLSEIAMKHEHSTEMYHDEEEDDDDDEVGGAFASDADDENDMGNEDDVDEDESMGIEDSISNEENRIEESETSQLKVEQPCVPTEQPGENRKPAATSRSRKPKESEFKCPHCRRRCQNQDALILHMSHHKQQVQCSQCGIWLADKSVLNRHMRGHTGVRPFSCKFCNETFTRQDIAKKHTQRKHKEMLN